LNQLEDFHEIQQRGDAIEDDLEATLFNAIASTITNGGRLYF
jgi:hypothetical protein